MNINIDLLQHILDESVASGEECGLQLTVYQGGQLAADLCAGYTDASRQTPVSQSSIFPLFSSGKAIMATAFHMLQEEYGFDYNEKVCKYWSEFTGQGKENTEIHHVLSHRTGLHMLPGVQDSSDQLADWNFMCSKLCAASPKWTPGTKCGYQGITFAWLLGELAYRISGIPFKQYIQDKIISPLGLEKEFFFGLPDEAEKNIVDIDDSDFKGAYTFTKCFYSKRILRQAFIPSANGMATARAAAKIFNNLYHADGKAPLMKKETLERATRLNRHPDDPIPPREWAKFGLGYALPLWETMGGDIFGHGGAAGAELFYCKSRDLALCFVKNRVLVSHPQHPIRDRISAALGLPERFW